MAQVQGLGMATMALDQDLLLTSMAQDQGRGMTTMAQDQDLAWITMDLVLLLLLQGRGMTIMAQVQDLAWITMDLLLLLLLLLVLDLGITTIDMDQDLCMPTMAKELKYKDFDTYMVHRFVITLMIGVR